MDEKSTSILKLMSQLLSTEEILTLHPEWSWRDIAVAAEDALAALADTETACTRDRHKGPVTVEHYVTLGTNYHCIGCGRNI